MPRDDLLVIASPGARGGTTSLTVLQLVDETEAQQCRSELDRLVADFRAVAHGLVEQFREHVEPEYERGEPYPDELDFGGQRWWLEIHGEHCRFEGFTDGVVVEAAIGRPETVDAYFLLLFARSSGRYPRVRAACLAGSHDMTRLLRLAGHLP